MAHFNLINHLRGLHLREFNLSGFNLIGFIMAASLVITPALAAETRKAEAGKPAPKAALGELAWLEGTWVGEGLGGEALVVYSAAYDNQMLAHFRQGKAGKVQFFEIAAIADVAGSLEYRVKHFNADMTAWEDKAEIQKFSLVAVEKDVWYFDGLTVRRTGANAMTETVLIERKDGTTFEAAFIYKRAK